MTRLQELLARVVGTSGPIAATLSASEWHELHEELESAHEFTSKVGEALDKWETMRSTSGLNDSNSTGPWVHAFNEAEKALDGLCAYRDRVSLEEWRRAVVQRAMRGRS